MRCNCQGMSQREYKVDGLTNKKGMLKMLNPYSSLDIVRYVSILIDFLVFSLDITCILHRKLSKQIK